MVGTILGNYTQWALDVVDNASGYYGTYFALGTVHLILGARTRIMGNKH